MDSADRLARGDPCLERSLLPTRSRAGLRRNEGFLRLWQGLSPEFQGAGVGLAAAHGEHLSPHTEGRLFTRIFSVASGSARQILRDCFSGPRPLGMHRPLTDSLQTVASFRPSVHHGRLSNSPCDRAREPRIRSRATVPYFTVSAPVRLHGARRSDTPQTRGFISAGPFSYRRGGVDWQVN